MDLPGISFREGCLSEVVDDPRTSASSNGRLSALGTGFGQSFASIRANCMLAKSAGEMDESNFGS